MQFFFSNHLDLLIEKSLPFLFSTTPLQKKIVVSPNRKYFQKAVAEKTKIATGIQFLSLFQAIEFFSDKQFPSTLELSVAIREKIRAGAEFPFSGQESERNIFAQFSDLFFQYGLYGGDLLKEFEKKRDWQDRLFLSLFVDEVVSFPCRDLKNVKCSEMLKGSQIHIFGYSFLPKVFLDFFFKLSRECSIFFYFLSPTRFFWEDHCSDRERVYLQKHWKRKGVSERERETLDTYLRFHHPLLSNLGKLGRENLKQLGTFDVWTDEEYRVPEGERFLAKIKTNLLDLESEGEPFLDCDSSLQIHGCGSSRLREVEILYQNLLQAVRNEGVLPSEILVLAPKIEVYAPLIHFVFQNANLPYRISGLPISDNSFFSRGMTALFSLFGGKIDKESLLDLFENPLFQSKHHLSKEEVHLFRKWLDETHMVWGWDLDHRKTFLENHWKADAFGTIENTIEKILTALVQKNYFFEVEWSDTETLHKFLKLLTSLKEDLHFIEIDSNRTLLEWNQILCLFAESYFGSPQDEAVSLFQQFRARLQKYSSKFPAALVPFSWIFNELKSEWDRKGYHFQAHLLSSIHFASFEEKNLSPHKMVCLIGMDEESFPNLRPVSPFDKFQDYKQHDYCPPEIEKDRYLFLETLLHAEEFLWIHYRNLSSKDGHVQNPSSVLQDFFSYLSKVFSVNVNEKFAIFHPQISFHESYFQNKNSALPFFSYQAAKAHYQNFSSFSLLSKFSKPSFDFEKEPIVQLDSLRLLLKDPLRFFCNESLHLYLSWEEEENPFGLSLLDRYQIRREVLQTPFEKVWEKMMQKIPLPPLFEEREKEKTKEEIRPILDLQIQEIFSLYLSEENKNRHFCPIKIEGTKIVGEISDVCEKGLLCDGKKGFSSQWKMWADLLIFSLLPHHLPHHLIFLKEKNSPGQSFFIEEPKLHLKKLLEYYFFAKKHISPLKKQWAEEIFSKEEKRLHKLLKKDFLSLSKSDPYHRWLFLNSSIPKANELVAEWNDFSKELFQPVTTAFS
jgi:exodeoxyribonuclease V gamma subunit